MRSTPTGMRAGRIAVSVVAASLALASCRADGVTGQAASCTDQPGCDTTTQSVSPHVLAAIDDAGTRLTGALSHASASQLRNTLGQLELALTRNDLQAGRMALASTYDVIGFAERATPEARPDLGAIRLALIPAARALGVATSVALPETP
jgi:hypothetical protein